MEQLLFNTPAPQQTYLSRIIKQKLLVSGAPAGVEQVFRNRAR